MLLFTIQRFLMRWFLGCFTEMNIFEATKMVGICGLEPQTSSLSVTRSNQLSYIPTTRFVNLVE